MVKRLGPLDRAPAPTSAALAVALGPELDSALAFAKASKSENTQRAYTREWKAFAAWCASRGVSALPAAPATLAAYIAGLADGTVGTRARKPAGIDLALAAVAFKHKTEKLLSPRATPEVDAVRAGIRREIGVAPRQAEALLVPELRRAVALLPDTPAGLRDKALILTGWTGAFRRSPLVALELDDLTFTSEGVVLTIRKDKTDQEQKGRQIAIPFGTTPEACPVRALSTWVDLVEAAGNVNGPVFRKVDRHGNIGKKALSARTVGRIVKDAITSIGLDPKGFSAHSLRAGFATAASRAGRNARDIMRQTGHTSSKSLDRYIRAAEMWDENPARGLL
jgi:integrase